MQIKRLFGSESKTKSLPVRNIRIVCKRERPITSALLASLSGKRRQKTWAPLHTDFLHLDPNDSLQSGEKTNVRGENVTRAANFIALQASKKEVWALGLSRRDESLTTYEWKLGEKLRGKK